MSKIKVLHIINGEFYAGAERVQDHLALCLPLFDVEVGFVCVKPRDFPKETIASNTPILQLPMLSKIDLKVVRAIADYAKKNKYSLIHSHTPRAAFVGRPASLIAGLPMVHHIHSPTSEDTENPIRNRINAIVEKLSLVGVDRLIAVSDAMKQYLLRRGFNPKKIVVVCNGVPTIEQYSPRRNPEKEWVFGTVAYFRPRKGLDVLIKALKVLEQKNQKYRLRVIGSFETEEYRQEIVSLSESLGVMHRIDWVGFTNDVLHELEKLHLFVLPSLFGEGLPMVVLEAMSTGLPVVATRVEGIPEAVREGVDGKLVEPGDPVSLANALIGVVSSKEEWGKMCLSAYHRQKNSFSDLSMARKVAEVYRQLV